MINEKMIKDDFYLNKKNIPFVNQSGHTFPTFLK